MKQKLLLQRTVALYAALTLSSLAGSAFAQEKNPDRSAYLGEEHIHTSWSVSAQPPPLKKEIPATSGEGL